MASISRVVSLAREALASGDLPRAARLVGDVGPVGDIAERAALVRVRAQLAIAGAGHDAASSDALIAEAVAIADCAPVPAAMTFADTAVLLLYRGEATAAVAILERAAPLAEADAAAARQVRLLIAIAHAMRGEQPDIALLAAAALEPFGDIGSVIESTHALQLAVIAAASVERYDVAASVAQRATVAARQVGAVGVLPLLLCLLANSCYFTGDYDTALLAAGEAHDLAIGTGESAMRCFAAACAALVHAVRGNAEEVERWSAIAEPLLTTSGMTSFARTLTCARGLLALGAGDAETAAALYDDLEKQLGHDGARQGVLQWQGDRIEALLAAGRDEDARAALRFYEATVGEVPLGWSDAVVARCRGHLAEFDWAEHFSRAVELHRPELSRFELGRTHLAWARRCAETGQAEHARAQYQKAIECFERTAARPWLARAQTELTAIHRSPRPSAPTVVRALGPLTVIRDGTELPVPVGVAGTLLRLLVARRGRATVDQVVESLWPGADERLGATRLRNVLSRLRRQVGEIVVRADRLLLWAGGVVVDADEFDRDAARAIQSGDLELARLALARYRDDLLPEARYADWADAPRERLRSLARALVRLLADAAEAEGDVPGATLYLERAMTLDPDDETLALRAATAAWRRGDTSAARRLAHRAATISEALGEPLPHQLRVLLAELRA